MTERLYYTDAYLRQFEATVAQVSDDGRQVRLDRTAFYPTSGGQPFDTGLLGGVAVVDVIDEDDAIVHHLAAPLDAPLGGMVRGAIDWPRRFDHMQQHTGQHLLSALLADRLQWPTTSVHFGTEYSTVDVAAKAASESAIADIEREANSVIAANVPVSVTFEHASAAAGLRKPSDRPGVLRVVTIEGVDRSACGGTHVMRTGEIGGMLLRRVERMKGQVRIEFLCGQRAVNAARNDYQVLGRASRVLSANPSELPALVETQVQRSKQLERDLRRAQAEIAQWQARFVCEEATTDAQGVARIHFQSVDDVRTLQPLATAITALCPSVVLVTSRAAGAILLVTSPESGVDAGATMKSVATAHAGRGGGSPRVAQGSFSTDAAFDAIVSTLGVVPHTVPDTSAPS